MHCLCWLLGLTCVSDSLAGAGAVQWPEPPAATPATSLPSPCPWKPPHRNSLKTTGALPSGLLRWEGRDPAQAPGAHTEVPTLGLALGSASTSWSRFLPLAQR